METKDIKDISDSKLVTSIYSDVASPAMKQVGQSIESLLKFVALPFKFLGLTAEELEKKYTKFIKEAVNRVPPEKLTAPKSSIVAPLLDCVKFCFDDEPGNDLLREMFSKLLSSSMNQDNISYLNKSFVETMRFLSGNEAKFLQWCSDAIITRRAYDDLKQPTHIFADSAILSVFNLYECENFKETTEIPSKIMEISTATPCSSMRFDFPIESLDILASLGLVEFKKEVYIGKTLFEDLIRLKSKGMLDFELPSLFVSAMSYIKTGKCPMIVMGGTKTKYSDLFLSFLYKSEIPQLYDALSQNQNISMKQLMKIGCSRSEIYVTQYGRRFLNCCIQ